MRDSVVKELNPSVHHRLHRRLEAETKGILILPPYYGGIHFLRLSWL
jgi:hypothetical protein